MYLQMLKDLNGNIINLSHLQNPQPEFSQVILTHYQYAYVPFNCDTTNCIQAYKVQAGSDIIGIVEIHSIPENSQYYLTSTVPSDKVLKKRGLTFNDIARSYTLFAYLEGEFVGFIHLNTSTKDYLDVARLNLFLEYPIDVIQFLAKVVEHFDFKPTNVGFYKSNLSQIMLDYLAPLAVYEDETGIIINGLELFLHN